LLAGPFSSPVSGEQFGRVRQKWTTINGPPRRRARFASAKGALQYQPSANGLGIVTHKIPSPEGAYQTFARLHASHKCTQIPNPRGTGLQRHSARHI